MRGNRQVTLQPNEKIEKRHPPTNREAATNIATKDRVHRVRNMKNILRVKKDLDEFLRVPGINESQITIHRAAEQPLVFPEDSRPLLRMVEHNVKSVGTIFAGEEGKKNTAAENRIDETRRITCEHPAITGEAALSIREIGARVNR